MVLAACAVGAAQVRADEGMWLFNQPPRQVLREKYGFEPDDAWFEHVQKSSVRFNSGGSGSFVSEDGLVMSNHHVGADALQKFGDQDHNYLRDGFCARTLAEEKRCLDLELNVLMSIEDVTERVNAAVKSDLTPEQAFLARRKVMAAIEKESQDQTGLRSDVITLFQGRALGVRAGAADRLLRRGPGQLRVSALRPGHLFLPCVREWAASQSRASFAVEPGRGERR
jgi:hypothetical protein